MNRNGKKKMKRGLGVAYCTLIYLFLFLPIAVVAANSFNASTTKPYLSWKGFTLDWYVRLFDNGSLLEAFGNTMLIAAASTVLSTVIGTLGAVGMQNGDPQGAFHPDPGSYHLLYSVCDLQCAGQAGRL